MTTRPQWCSPSLHLSSSFLSIHFLLQNKEHGDLLPRHFGIMSWNDWAELSGSPSGHCLQDFESPQFESTALRHLWTIRLSLRTRNQRHETQSKPGSGAIRSNLQWISCRPLNIYMASVSVVMEMSHIRAHGTHQDQKSLKESSGVRITGDTITFSLGCNGIGRLWWKKNKKKTPCVCCSHKTQWWFFWASFSTCCLEMCRWNLLCAQQERRSCFDDWENKSRWLALRAFDSHGWVVGLRGGMFSRRKLDLHEVGPFFLGSFTKTLSNMTDHNWKKKQRSHISLRRFCLCNPLTLLMATEPGTGPTTRFSGFSAVSFFFFFWNSSPSRECKVQGCPTTPCPRCHRPNAIICIIPGCII